MGFLGKGFFLGKSFGKKMLLENLPKTN